MRMFCTDPHDELVILQRVRRAEHAKNQSDALAYVLEKSAVEILRRYDVEAVDEFYRLVDQGKREHIKPYVTAVEPLEETS